IGTATRAANRCWIWLQVNGMSPNGGGWRVCSVTAATTKNAYASMARVTHPIPGTPAADLMLVQPAQPLAGLERLLHPPARPRHPHQSDQRQADPAGAQVVAQLPGAQAAADQQP